MANEIKAVSIDDLQQKCQAYFCVYSPSRGKIYDFSSFKRHNTITSNSLTAIGKKGCVFEARYGAQKELGLAVADGWTDAAVKIVYIAPSFTNSSGVWAADWAKIDTLSTDIDLQSFAEWLINNNYAQIVSMVGDL